MISILRRIVENPMINRSSICCQVSDIGGFRLIDFI